MTDQRLTVALSIRQPWCWAILFAGKDIENRNWPTDYRGRVLIHAAKTLVQSDYVDAAYFIEGLIKQSIHVPPSSSITRGGIIGEVEIVDCVTQSNSPWFFGRYGFVLRKARPLQFQPCKGKLGFFTPELTEAGQ